MCFLKSYCMNCKDIKGIFIHCLVPSSDFQRLLIFTVVVYRRKMTKTVIFQNLMDLTLYKRNIFILFFSKKDVYNNMYCYK